MSASGGKYEKVDMLYSYFEMVLNAEASSAYFLYPTIAENFIKSIKSNCEKICKDFYESGTKAYDVDCTFIMDDCYGGEIFTIVNGEAQ